METSIETTRTLKMGTDVPSSVSTRLVASASIAILMVLSCVAMDLQTMPLTQGIDTNSMDAVRTGLAKLGNGTIIVKTEDSDIHSINPRSRLYDINGITFDIYEDGEFNIHFEDDGRTPFDKIVVNDTTMMNIIQDIVAKKVLDLVNDEQSPISQLLDRKVRTGVGNVTNTVLSMVYNPLWGKKLVALGDSLISSPSPKETQSYPGIIAARNNMVLVHKGTSGKKLCADMPGTPGQAVINSYTNDIPIDADYILVQVGVNDENFDDSVPDTDMTLNTFKGCWNNLLLGIKTRYPHAHFGVILSNTWTDNLGQKSDDVATNDWRRAMTQWQKTQCQKLNIPVLDPVDDTKFFVFNMTTTNLTASAFAEYDEWYWTMKRQMGTSNYNYNNQVLTQQSQYMVDYQHTTYKGNLLLASFYEFWMKTVLTNN